MCGGPGPKLCARRPGVGPLGDPGLAAGGVWGGGDFGASFRFVCGLLLGIPGHMVCLVLVIRFHDDLDYLHFWQQAFQNMPDMSSEKH